MALKESVCDIPELIGMRIIHTVPEYGPGRVRKAYLTVDSEIYVFIDFDNQRKANPFSIIECIQEGLIKLDSKNLTIDRLIQIAHEKERSSQDIIAEIRKRIQQDKEKKKAEEERIAKANSERLRLEALERIELEALLRKREEEERAARAHRNMLLLKAQEEDRRKRAQREAERQRLELQKQVELAARQARKDHLIVEIKKVLDTDYFSARPVFDKSNIEDLLTEQDFIDLQKRFVTNWFAKVLPNSNYKPDADQTAAIGATEKNIQVVARAGSGKTSTIVNRFHFLVGHCGVDPSSVLMLAFNRKAVEELRDRTDRLLISSGKINSGKPHILTFHALARSIVNPSETLIYDEGESGSNMLSQTIQKIIDKRLKDIVWLSRIRKIMLEYFKDDWDKIVKGGYHLSKEEQVQYRRSLQHQSLNGDYVKSYGEKLIANILFEHDIDYAYEKTFRWDNSYYRPDFTISLPANKWLIIEYFGLAGNTEYDEQILQKRQYWSRRENYTLFELYPADIAAGEESVVSTLRNLFSVYNMSFNKLSDEEIWNRIRERAIDTFTRTVTSFISRCRKKDLTIDDLREKVKDYQTDNPTEKLFLSVCGSIYKEYLQTLYDEKLEDFDGLISRACDCISNGQTDYDKLKLRANLKGLSFIMVDEYQDFSYLFDRLLETVRAVCPNAGIFCVGDDWQAINGFAGSDVSYFLNFTKRYGDSGRYAIKTNYRSAKRIVNAGTNLMRNDTASEQIQPFSTLEGTVAIGYYDQFEPSNEELAAFQTDSLTPAVLRLVNYFLNQEKRVVLLYRTNERLPLWANIPDEIKGKPRDRFTDYIKSFFPASERDKIRSSTTHQFKGKEEDVVIIMDAMSSFYPLIHPAWGFMKIFGDTLDGLIEDERRLFYVAITRAKTDLVLLTTQQQESPFLAGLRRTETLYWEQYPAFSSGKRKARITITNQRGFGSNPTYSIKSQLKAAGFEYDQKSRCWFRLCDASVNLQDTLREQWAENANHIEVSLYSENNEMREKLVITDGITVYLEPDSRP